MNKIIIYIVVSQSLPMLACRWAMTPGMSDSVTIAPSQAANMPFNPQPAPSSRTRFPYHQSDTEGKEDTSCRERRSEIKETSGWSCTCICFGVVFCREKLEAFNGIAAVWSNCIRSMKSAKTEAVGQSWKAIPWFLLDTMRSGKTRAEHSFLNGEGIKKSLVSQGELIFVTWDLPVHSTSIGSWTICDRWRVLKGSSRATTSC